MRSNKTSDIYRSIEVLPSKDPLQKLRRMSDDPTPENINKNRPNSTKGAEKKKNSLFKLDSLKS